MTWKADLAVLIALCAALASAFGDVIRQRSAQEITDKPAGHLALFRMSLRDGRWWLGGAGAVTNYALQAGALALASVMLVTSLQVTALLFALPIYTWLTKHRVTRWEWMWAALLAMALAGMIFQQSAFRAGALTTSLPTITVAKPVVASALGVAVLGETINADGPEVIWLIAAVVVVVAATVALARGEAAM